MKNFPIKIQEDIVVDGENMKGKTVWHSRSCAVADLENIELMYLKELIPEEPTKEDILDWLEDHSYTSIERKEMGKVIKEIKASLPAADGKMVSEIVKTLIK